MIVREALMPDPRVVQAGASAREAAELLTHPQVSSVLVADGERLVGCIGAEDIVAAWRDRLAERVSRERLDNVSVRLGEPADPKLPPTSFDRVLMVHMYHEIEQPYEFLWRLFPALKSDGLVVVVDADRRTKAHGTPPALLKCEFEAVGFTQVSIENMPSAGGYLATFRATGPRPDPKAIRPCRMQDN